MSTETFIATSIARRLMARIQLTHERRSISVFAGPPGIGKTTVIDAFAERSRGNVVVVKVSRRNAREALALQHILDGLGRLAGAPVTEFPNSTWPLRNAVFRSMCAWAGADARSAKRGEYQVESFPRLTIAFDEAQNLSRGAIEALRYWNDADRCYAPFPVGMVFVGNSEFSLQADSDGQSPISAAVADRALYIQNFDYADVTDDDLRLFLESRGVVDTGAVAALIRRFKAPRSTRSLRQVQRVLDELKIFSSGAPITADTVKEVVGIS